MDEPPAELIAMSLSLVGVVPYPCFILVDIPSILPVGILGFDPVDVDCPFGRNTEVDALTPSEVDPSDEWLNFRLFTLEIAILIGGVILSCWWKRSCVYRYLPFRTNHVISEFLSCDIGGNLSKMVDRWN
jgi:hypothetical protein